MQLTPAILECLAHGLYDLNKGDPKDLEVAAAVETQMLREHHLVHKHGEWIPAGQATDGFVDGCYVMQGADGQFRDLRGNMLPPGTQVYFEPTCETPVRTV
jgi:hypothetical protein